MKYDERERKDILFTHIPIALHLLQDFTQQILLTLLHVT